jgi:peptidoglycan LD-endopeptidase LytH
MTASGFGRWPRALPSGALLALALLLPACDWDPVDDQAGSPAANATDEIAAAPEATPFFRLPTANRALLDAETEEQFFTGTVGRPWTSGTFGCVRSEGYQLHEGLDIRAIERDSKGEALDPILAAADGTVAYINSKAGLSSYGIYLILRHQFQGWEIFTLYAHLARIADHLRPGLEVKGGDILGIMGRTANTRHGISKDRAHLHFEINLMVNDRFPAWHRKHYPGQRDDHGIWNGRNFLGIDPRPIFLQEHLDPASLDLSALIRQQPVLCRTLVRTADFPWLHRYPATVDPAPAADITDIGAFEIHHNFLGIPIRIIPRAAEPAKGRSRIQLLDVDAAVARDFPCQKLVRQRDGRWQFTPEGERFLDLLTF